MVSFTCINYSVTTLRTIKRAHARQDRGFEHWTNDKELDLPLIQHFLSVKCRDIKEALRTKIISNPNYQNVPIQLIEEGWKEVKAVQTGNHRPLVDSEEESKWQPPQRIESKPNQSAANIQLERSRQMKIYQSLMSSQVLCNAYI